MRPSTRRHGLRARHLDELADVETEAFVLVAMLKRFMERGDVQAAIVETV